MNGVKSIDGKTCDPQYRNGVSSSACDKVFAEYCDKSRIFSDEKCKQWATKVAGDPTWASVANAAKASHCADSPDNPECPVWGSNDPAWRTIVRNHCTGSNLSKPMCQQETIKYGGNDNAVITWCASNGDNKYCSCLKNIEYSGSDPLLRELMKNTQCYSGDCQKYGYMTEGQRKYSCPATLNICSNIVDLKGIRASDLSNMVQKCEINTAQGQTAVNPPPSQSRPSAVSPSNVSPYNVSSSNSVTPNGEIDEMMFVMVFIFLIIMLLALTSVVIYQKYYADVN